ncbi:MAG: class I SAM-dependent methyltransferase [Chloroflexota bacterium]
MHALGLNHRDNLAWNRQMAAGLARRMMTGDTPAAWANNTALEVQFAVNHLRLAAGDRLLDLGCGWGRHSLPLVARGLRVTGLDLSHELLALARYHARQHGLAVDWVEGDLAHPPLRGPFDAIAQFCGNLLTWFPDRASARDALWRVAGLLRPGGRLLFGSEDWQPELPPRAQHWDEWHGGAAIYRQRFDAQRRIAHHQAVVFGPAHHRREYRQQTWWPALVEMERLFAEVGLVVVDRRNGCADVPYDPDAPGLVYVLAREGTASNG